MHQITCRFFIIFPQVTPWTPFCCYDPEPDPSPSKSWMRDCGIYSQMISIFDIASLQRQLAVTVETGRYTWWSARIASGWLIASRFAVSHGHTVSSTIIAGLSETAGTLLETFGNRTNEIESRTTPDLRTSRTLRQKWSIFYTYTRHPIYSERNLK